MRTAVSAFTVVACLAYVGVATAQQDPSAPLPPAPAPAAAPSPAAAPAEPPTLATSTAASGVAPTSSDLPAPEAQTTTKSFINRPVLVTSLLFLGGTYLASAVDGATSGRDADRNNLFYPVVGPWMDYANRDCGVPNKCNANEGGYKALLVLDGIGQGLGALGVITSFFIPEKTTRNWYLIGSSQFHAAPSPIGTGYGLGAAGEF
jgi:hypothetical protein